MISDDGIGDRPGIGLLVRPIGNTVFTIPNRRIDDDSVSFGNGSPPANTRALESHPCRVTR